jgi:hypothetical protein
MTKEKVDELLKEKEKRSAELEILKNKTDKDIWEEDLKVFEVEYKKHMDEFFEYLDIDPKSVEKTAMKTINRKVTITKKSSTTPSVMTTPQQSAVPARSEPTHRVPRASPPLTSRARGRWKATRPRARPLPTRRAPRPR